MEPITVKSKLDLKTYYKISMLIVIKRIPVILIFVMFVLCAGLYVYDGVYEWDTSAYFILWSVLYFILIPAITWFSCKRNMTQSPVLAEGATYTISDEWIEVVTSSTINKTDWKYIKKATENDEYFIMYTGTRNIHYLPKDGFATADDMMKFKEMVKANNIKAYFK